MEETKFCKYCGEKIPYDAVICTKCGRQVEKLSNDREGIIINNVSNSSSSSSSSSSASAAATNAGAERPVKWVNKWVSFFLCLLLGWIGAHKFYEGKMGMGILYLCTLGLFCIGWVIDIISILMKPNPYAV